MNEERVIGHLPMGSYYLGELSKDLRELKGYAVFAQELIQNADDAKGNDTQARANKIVFDITDTACLVWNDGSFSNCGRQTLPAEDCPWRISHQHMCDLHRFRLRASADKRNEEGTTGGFGIGFVSVYQITDHPELQTGDVHWRLRPENSENERVEILDIEKPTHGTQITLPWATDGETVIRRKLFLEPVTPDQIEEMANEIGTALPHAILFLRHLNHLELRRNGVIVRKVVCVREDTEGEGNIRKLIVEDGSDCTIWNILESRFDQEANLLREKHGGLIEKKRQPRVLLALPDILTIDFIGLLCATLPTQEPLRLPLHINADFYPSSNRKRILFDNDFQGEWNAAAIRATAQCLVKYLPELKEILGYVGIWSLATKAKNLCDTRVPTVQGQCFTSFWEEIKEPISKDKYVWTTSETWTTPADVYLLKEPKDATIRQNFLIHVGVKTVHPDLRRFYALFRDRDINVQELSAVRLAEHLKQAGLDANIALTKAPKWIQSAIDRETLAGLIGTFGSEQNKKWTYDITSRKALEICALVVSTKGTLCLPMSCWQAPLETQQTLACLPDVFNFVSDDNPEPLIALCPSLQVRDIVTKLTTISRDDLQLIWQTFPEDWLALLELLDNASTNEWSADPVQLKQILRLLPIWPSGDNLFPLTELTVPGGFEDPLNLATLLDRRVIQRCTMLLKKLEPSSLTLSHYAIVELPRQLSSNNIVSEQAFNELICVLAKHLGEIRDNQAAQQELSKCPLILCTDGLRRAGRKVYLDSPFVRDVLGDSVSMVAIENSDAKLALYRWLMISEMPRGEDVVARIQEICSEPPVGERREVIKRLIANLGRCWEKIKDEAEALKPLCTLAWIPAIKHQDRWLQPEKVYASYSQYLFATQADFIDLPIKDQNASGDFFAFLEIGSQPTSDQIVNHLLDCSKHNVSVNEQVYTVLQDRLGNPKQHEDIEIALEKLKGAPCLSIPGAYVLPSDVYWEPTSYGRYARHLGEDTWKYRSLFDWLGVQSAPSTDNVFQIMERISIEFSTEHLDDDGLKVLECCWRYLNNQLAMTPPFREDIKQHLGKRKIIADIEGYLIRPHEVCFQDRPLLVEKFHSDLHRHILVRQQGIWQAMEAVGVRPFSQCVSAHLNELEGEQEVPEFTDKLKVRRYLLDRVIEPQASDSLFEWNMSLLNNLRIFHARLLRVVYQVEMGGRTVASAQETPDVFYDASAGILYFRTETPPWTAIAREIVYALNPSVEAGTIAMTLSMVLSALSDVDAEKALDEAGFAPLGRAVHRDTVASVSLNIEDSTEGFTDSSEWETEGDGEISFVTRLDISSGIDAESCGNQEATSVSKNQQDGTSMSPQTVNDPKAGSGKIQTSQDTEHSPNSSKQDIQDQIYQESEQPPSDTSLEREQPKRPPRTNSQGGRLYSYVASTNEEGEKKAVEGDGIQERREATDIAGIEMAMEYERLRGRSPIEQDHYHPGFDILSLEPDQTTVARYIEVKSISVRWGQKGVGLTATQFSTAKREGDQFWLYVVECAGTEDAVVIPIQNPAHHVSQFYFDSNWKSLEVREEVSIHDHHVE